VSPKILWEKQRDPSDFTVRAHSNLQLKATQLSSVYDFMKRRKPNQRGAVHIRIILGDFSYSDNILKKGRI